METRGDRIRKAREARGWTQKELAKLLDQESHSPVSDWESNKGPHADTLETLVRVLNVDGDWLLTGEGEMERGDKGTEALRLELVATVASTPYDRTTVDRVAAILRGADDAGGAGAGDLPGDAGGPQQGTGGDR